MYHKLLTELTMDNDWKAQLASHNPALYIVQLNKTFAAHQLAKMYA